MSPSCKYLRLENKLARFVGCTSNSNCVFDDGGPLLLERVSLLRSHSVRFDPRLHHAASNELMVYGLQLCDAKRRGSETFGIFRLTNYGEPVLGETVCRTLLAQSDQRSVEPAGVP